MTPRQQAEQARAAVRTMGGLPAGSRASALHRIADALVARQEEILAENARDVAAVADAVARGEVTPSSAARLPLSPSKLAGLADGLRTIARSADPVGRVLRRTRLADGLVLRQVTSPLGVLLVIFESRPDALPQIAGLSLAAGNGVLLKGGREAAASNAVLHRVIVDALAPDIPAGAVQLVDSREAVSDLLAMDDLVDLVIPRGGNALVRHVQDSTRIPVLGHADGVCHVYVDAAADPARAARIVRDAKVDYPAACNAMETLLVHRSWAADGRMAALLREALHDVALHAPTDQAEALGLPVAPALHHEYGDLACTVAVVDDVDAAIRWIHAHGSGHTEAIVTGDAAVAARFLSEVDAACVFHDASTRFADGQRFGLGAEVGISTSRLHARGPVGVDGLLTTRWLLEGAGHTVADTRDGRVVLDPVSLPVAGES